MQERYKEWYLISKLQSNKLVYMKQKWTHMPVLRGLQNEHKNVTAVYFWQVEYRGVIFPYNFLEFSEHAYLKN